MAKKYMKLSNKRIWNKPAVSEAKSGLLRNRLFRTALILTGSPAQSHELVQETQQIAAAQAASSNNYTPHLFNILVHTFAQRHKK